MNGSPEDQPENALEAAITCPPYDSLLLIKTRAHCTTWGNLKGLCAMNIKASWNTLKG